MTVALWVGDMKALTWSVTVACLCVAAPALAQPQMTPPGAAVPTQAPPSNLESFEPYSENAALAWSLLATAAGYGAAFIASETENEPLAVAAAAGILVGPNAGDIYAGDGKRALVHSGIRAGGMVLVTVGAVQAFDDCFLEEDPCNSDGEALIFVGAGIFVADSLYSIFTASRTAREQNEKARQSLMITPAPMGNNGGYGLSLAGDF